MRQELKAIVRPQDKVLNFDYFFFISLLSVSLLSGRIGGSPFPADLFCPQLAIANRPGAQPQKIFKNPLTTPPTCAIL